MDVLVIGINHRTASVEVREKLSFQSNEIKDALQFLCRISGIMEAVIISTCNRVEFITIVSDVDRAIVDIKEFLSKCKNIHIFEIEKYLYTYVSIDAIRHIFRVTSSLDSMVVGEPQIIGQVKDAYRIASHSNTTGPIINKLMHRAFSVAKRVRTETNIGNNAVSISYAAVELAKKIFGTLHNKTVFIIGAGEMCELAMKHLKGSGIGDIIVTNRTYERAISLASEFKGTPVPFEDIAVGLKRADIVISSTGSSNFIVKKESILEIIKARKNRPMFFIDIAVPRDIDPRVNDIDNIYLYDIDDLEGVIEVNTREREKEAIKAEEIIAKETTGFSKWMMSLDAVPTIVSLRKSVEELRKNELEKALNRMESITDEQKKVIEILTSSIVNKILHNPIAALKKKAREHGGTIYIETVRRLFNLDNEDNDR